MCLHDCFDARAVLDAADGANEPNRRMVAAEFLLYVIQRELAELKQHDSARIEPGNLPAQFASDRSAGAGNHDHTSVNPFLERCGVQGNRVAPEQLVEFYVPDLRNCYFPAHEVVI